MLGVRQRVELRRALRSSTATWKVIVNEVPIQQYYALPYDRCEGYAAEREQLLAFLHGFLGQTDAGTAIDALFFKPAPPNGMGCSARPSTRTATRR